jgi:predicted transcriptional regulator
MTSFTATISESTYARLTEVSRREDRSMSSIVRKALDEFLTREETFAALLADCEEER